jgi:hypothetical protein
MLDVACKDCGNLFGDQFVVDGDDVLCTQCAESRLVRIRTALKNLLDKLDLVNASPEYKGIWTIAHAHGIEYTGPTYEVEFYEARNVIGEGRRDGRREDS